MHNYNQIVHRNCILVLLIGLLCLNQEERVLREEDSHYKEGRYCVSKEIIILLVIQQKFTLQAQAKTRI